MAIKLKRKYWLGLSGGFSELGLISVSPSLLPKIQEILPHHWQVRYILKALQVKASSRQTLGFLLLFKPSKMAVTMLMTAGGGRLVVRLTLFTLVPEGQYSPGSAAPLHNRLAWDTFLPRVARFNAAIPNRQSSPSSLSLSTGSLPGRLWLFCL